MTKEQYDNPKVRAKTLLRIHRKAKREPKGVPPKSDAIIQLGKSLKEKRTTKNWSLKLLEEKSGIGFSYILKTEQGKTNPTIETLEKLARAMNCKLEINFVRNKSSESEDNSGPDPV